MTDRPKIDAAAHDREVASKVVGKYHGEIVAIRDALLDICDKLENNHWNSAIATVLELINNLPPYAPEQLAAYLVNEGNKNALTNVSGVGSISLGVVRDGRQNNIAAKADNAWREAIIETCVVNCIGWDANDPIKTLRNLICWEVQVALDPKVSKAACELQAKALEDAAGLVANDPLTLDDFATWLRARAEAIRRGE